MKQINIILIAVYIMLTFTSCVSTACAYETNPNENVVVDGETCYVYYTNPTTLFLNTLQVVDGAYYYWHLGKRIPVVFPYWEAWSPHRYFYYDRNHWTWRDRHYGYNHMEYRRNQHWVDHRKPNIYHRTTTPRPTIRHTYPNGNTRRITPLQPQNNRQGLPNRGNTITRHGNFGRGSHR